MPLDIQPELPPLRVDASGAVRVGQTRVLFVLVVQAFRRGESPEAIVEAFDTLSLADTYAAIAYYLRHREEVEAFLAEYDRAAEAVWEKIRTIQGDQSGIRARLLARMAAKEAEQKAAPPEVG
jgi:uncharacterized protein (DUF433 family)